MSFSSLWRRITPKPPPVQGLIERQPVHVNVQEWEFPGGSCLTTEEVHLCDLDADEVATKWAFFCIDDITCAACKRRLEAEYLE